MRSRRQGRGQQTQGQDQSNFITKDEFYSYVRSDSFRSVMKNQNSDLYDFGKWQDYIPQMKAYGGVPNVDPVLGTNSVTRGRYTRIGNTVICDFYIKFGSGMSPGNGQYYITGPEKTATKSITTTTQLPFTDFAEPQAYQGHFYASQGSVQPGWQTRFWGHVAIGADPSTGEAYNPTRFLMLIGDTQRDVVNGTPWGSHQQDIYVSSWPVGYNGLWETASGTPIEGTCFTGRVTYEAEPNGI